MLAALLLSHQVACAVLTALDRERQRREHTGGDEDSPEPSTAAGFFLCCHEETLHPVNRAARILRRAAELLLDAEQLVVLRDAVRAGRGSRLDLAGTRADGEIGD